MNVKDRLEALNKLGNVPDVSPHYNATRYGPSNDERNKKIAKMNVCLDGFKVWCEHIMLLLSFNDSHHTAFNDIATKTLVYHSQGGFYQEGYAKMQSILDTAKSDLESAIVSEKGDFGNEERRHNENVRLIGESNSIAEAANELSRSSNSIAKLANLVAHRSVKWAVAAAVVAAVSLLWSVLWSVLVPSQDEQLKPEVLALKSEVLALKSEVHGLQQSVDAKPKTLLAATPTPTPATPPLAPKLGP